MRSSLQSVTIIFIFTKLNSHCFEWRKIICICIWIRDKNFGTTTLPLSSQYSVICNVDFFSQMWIKLNGWDGPSSTFVWHPKWTLILTSVKYCSTYMIRHFQCQAEFLSRMRIPSVLMSADDKGTIRYRIY